MLNYVLIGILAFVLEIIDASFGMGYGTILTPALLLLGLEPLQVVPAVIASQLVGDFLAVFDRAQNLGQSSIIEIVTDREENLAVHTALQDKIKSAIESF